jgi:hypothetical protein
MFEPWIPLPQELQQNARDCSSNSMPISSANIYCYNTSTTPGIAGNHCHDQKSSDDNCRVVLCDVAALPLLLSLFLAFVPIPLYSYSQFQ